MPRKTVPIQADDIYKIQQPSACRLSPDGKNVAVVVSCPDKETLKNLSHVWLVPTDGGPARPFTQGKGGDNHPRFSPDGRTLAFLSARSGKSEIWTMPTDGGEAKQLTKLRRHDRRLRILSGRAEARDRLCSAGPGRQRAGGEEEAR